MYVKVILDLLAIYNNILYQKFVICIKYKIKHSDRDQLVIKISFNHWLMFCHILYKKEVSSKNF